MKTAKQLLYSLACLIGVHRVVRWLNRKRLLIVVYHGVAAEPLPTGLADWALLRLSDFRRQLAYLCRRYDLVPIDEALTALQENSLRRPTACITFDDGYLNNRLAALPILAEYGAPATIYLATGLVGTDRRLWTVKLETAVRRTDATALRPGDAPPIELGDDASRIRTARRLIQQMKRLEPGSADARAREIVASCGDTSTDDSDHYRMMTWDDVSAIAESGLVTFGGHTVSHAIVSRLGDAEVDAEIRGSIQEVAKRVSARTATFAYPNGNPEDFDERAQAAVRGSGLNAAVSTISGLNDRNTDRFALKRISVGRDTSFAEFRLLASGVLDFVRGLVRAGGRSGTGRHTAR